VSENLLWPGDDEDVPAWLLDGTLPQVPAWPRVWNYWLGGKDHYPADSQAAQAFAAVYPGIATLARSCQYFTARAARYLAFEAGIRQFLEIGAGLPVHDPVHQLAAPDSRVIYTARDPELIAYARGTLANAPGVETCYIHGALDNPEDLLSQALDALDLTRPAPKRGVVASVLGPRRQQPLAVRLEVAARYIAGTRQVYDAGIVGCRVLCTHALNGGAGAARDGRAVWPPTRARLQ
jgi:hypothetical protein